jgi:hypothetical protein
MLEEDSEYTQIRDRIQHRAVTWIVQGGDLAERGWRLMVLLARIEALPNKESVVRGREARETSEER